MSGLREYLETQLEAARKRMDPLEADAAELRAKLAKADGKVRALAREIAEYQKALTALGKPEKIDAPITIKEAILKVLATAPGGLTSNELLEAMNKQFFNDKLARTSMSPQLTRLKKPDQKVRQKGDRYFLA